MSSNSFCQKR